MNLSTGRRCRRGKRVDEAYDDLSSASTVGLVSLNDEGIMVVLRVVAGSGSIELAPAVPPISTSDDKSDDSTGGGDVGVDIHDMWATSAKPRQFLWGDQCACDTIH